MNEEKIPFLVCPQCFGNMSNVEFEDYSDYHNRTHYVCPYCGFDGDSVQFETSYSWHPIHLKNKTDNDL